MSDNVHQCGAEDAKNGITFIATASATNPNILLTVMTLYERLHGIWRLVHLGSCHCMIGAWKVSPNLMLLWLFSQLTFSLHVRVRLTTDAATLYSQIPFYVVWKPVFRPYIHHHPAECIYMLESHIRCSKKKHFALLIGTVASRFRFVLWPGRGPESSRRSFFSLSSQSAQRFWVRQFSIEFLFTDVCLGSEKWNISTLLLASWDRFILLCAYNPAKTEYAASYLSIKHISRASGNELFINQSKMSVLPSAQVHQSL